MPQEEEAEEEEEDEEKEEKEEKGEEEESILKKTNKHQIKIKNKPPITNNN